MTLSITKRTDDFSTSPQISIDDVIQIAVLGFKTIINNRPDGEGGEEQPTSEALKEKATALGLHYVYIPVIPNQIQQADIAMFTQVYADAPKPVLGFCRTGNRAQKIYSLSQV